MFEKRKLQFCMWKVRQNDLKVKNPFFVFEILIYFFVNLSSTLIQERLDPLSNGRF